MWNKMGPMFHAEFCWIGEFIQRMFGVFERL